MTLQPMVPLWRQLDAAADVLLAVRAGRTSAVALGALDSAVQPGVRAIAFQVLRRLGVAELLRVRLALSKPPPVADALLCCALALVSGNQEEEQESARYDAFTLVNQVVEAAKRRAEARGQATFINACLRRFLREREALLKAVLADPVARYNHPRWWIEQLRTEFPLAWTRILQANNFHPPLTLRVNVRKIPVPDYLRLLAEAGLQAQQVGAVALSLREPRPVQRIPGFGDGLISVQDAAAQLAAPLLLNGLARGGAKRLRVLDACAAPGGKTTHLLELADCDVTALDVDPLRCRRIDESLGRLSLCATVLAADAARPQDGWYQKDCGGEPFDAILLDAPCTASGIARRHPDVRWLRRPGDILQLARAQATLLDALWPLLKPGGRLLYATCSVFHAEGQDQIAAFLARHGDALLCPSPGHLLPGGNVWETALPHNRSGGHDGFFYALLERRGR